MYVDSNIDELVCKCCNNKYETKQKLDRHLYSLAYNLAHKEKNKLTIKKWEEANLNRVKKTREEFRSKNKEKINEKSLSYYYINKNKILERAKQYYINTKAERNKASGDYYSRNKEQHLDRMKEYFKTTQGKLVRKAVAHSRRLVLDGKHSKLTTAKIQEVYERNIKKYKTLTCELCFKPVKFGEDALEHFTPISRYEEFPHIDLNGGKNLGIVHGAQSKENCNGKKYNKTLKEWFELHPEYLEDGKKYIQRKQGAKC